MKLNILLIENQSFDMILYESSLQKKYNIDKAFDIEQAKGLLENENIHKYNLIIMDVMMPPMKLFSLQETEDGLLTGIRFFNKYIQNNPPDNPIPVIFLTAAKGDLYKKIRNFSLNNRQIFDVLGKNEYSPNDLKDYIEKKIT